MQKEINLKKSFAFAASDFNQCTFKFNFISTVGRVVNCFCALPEGCPSPSQVVFQEDKGSWGGFPGPSTSSQDAEALTVTPKDLFHGHRARNI